MSDYDLAVIGAGAAGLSVTAVAAQLGLRVALIEAGRMGGDCLNVGCVPSKALLAAAHAAEAVRDAARFGVLPAAFRPAPPRSTSPCGRESGEAADPDHKPDIVWDAVRAHVQGVIAAIAPNDSTARFEALGAHVFHAEARFVAPDVLAVGRYSLRVRRIVIAAGSRPAVPAIPGLDTVPYLTNETLFDLRERPEHLVILGGGPVGLEMADAHAGLGCRVTVIQSGRIAAKEDPELVEGLRSALLARGVIIHENARTIRVEPGPALILEDGLRITGSHLLVATGREPALGRLGLEAGGVAASARGIATDRGLRSVSNHRVYAIGDIADPRGIGPRAFTHVGSYHAGIVIRRALFHLPARVDYAALPRVTYTDPELAQVGLTEAEARAAGTAVSVLRWPLAENDRAQTERDPRGLVKLVVARGRVVGAGILARHAGEMIGMWTLAIARRLKVRTLADMILPYPTLAEAGKRAAGTYYLSTLFSPWTKTLVRGLSGLP